MAATKTNRHLAARTRPTRYVVNAIAVEIACDACQGAQPGLIGGLLAGYLCV
jgi:hypothetical protein